MNHRILGTGVLLAAGSLLLTAASAFAADPIGVTVEFTAASRDYNRTTAAEVTGCSLEGVLPADDVSCDDVGAMAHFDTKDAGTDKTVLGTGFGLGGDDAGRYEIIHVNSALADIRPAKLTVDFTAQSRDYDGTTAVAVTGCSLEGIFAPDQVDCDFSGAMARLGDENAGMAKTVTATGFGLGGDAAENYEIGGVNTTTVDIEKAAADCSSIDGYDVPFDGHSHTASGSCIGADGTDLASDLDLTGTTHSDPGTYTDPWTFDGGGNYEDARGSVTDVIQDSQPALTLEGFDRPVETSTSDSLLWNTVRSGRGVPLRFRVFADGTELTATDVVQSVAYATVACDGTAAGDPTAAASAGGSSLRYDQQSAQFVFNWRVPKPSGACYQLTLTTTDGSSLVAYFKTR